MRTVNVALKEDVFSDLVSSLLEQIARQPYVYTPKKFRRFAHPKPVLGWPDRLLTYRWGKSPDPFHDDARLDAITKVLNRYLLRLKTGGEIDLILENQVQLAATDLFKWGGVKRGNGHVPPDMGMVKSVIQTAIEREHRFNAPMDSAWTKLAALATDGLGQRGVKPQVIFDSRVSMSLVWNIDNVVECQRELLPVRNRLRELGLGFVSGRGGTRPEKEPLLRASGWRSAYGSWRAQFVASDLVEMMAARLNANHGFGRMPLAGGGCADWTVRGVEKVLFMDGY